MQQGVPHLPKLALKKGTMVETDVTRYLKLLLMPLRRQGSCCKVQIGAFVKGCAPCLVKSKLPDAVVDAVIELDKRETMEERAEWVMSMTCTL